MGIIRNQGYFQQCSVHLKLGVPGSRTRPWCPLWLPCFWMKICRTAPVWSLVPSSSNTGRWGTRALSAGPQRLRYPSHPSRGEAPLSLCPFPPPRLTSTLSPHSVHCLLLLIHSHQLRFPAQPNTTNAPFCLRCLLFKFSWICVVV